MECSQSFSRSKLPELLQFSRETSWRWTQCASWSLSYKTELELELQNVGSRCLSTTTTDTFSTTDFGGTQTNFSRTNSLTLEDTPTPSISTRKTFRNCGNSSNSTTKSLKQLKMRSPSPKPISNQTRGTLCLLAFTAGGNNLFEEVQTHPAGERTCCQKCTVLQRVTPGLMASSTTRQWPCTGTGSSVFCILSFVELLQVQVQPRWPESSFHRHVWRSKMVEGKSSRSQQWLVLLCRSLCWYFWPFQKIFRCASISWMTQLG